MNSKKVNKVKEEEVTLDLNALKEETVTVDLNNVLGGEETVTVPESIIPKSPKPEDVPEVSDQGDSPGILDAILGAISYSGGTGAMPMLGGLLSQASDKEKQEIFKEAKRPIAQVPAGLFEGYSPVDISVISPETAAELAPQNTFERVARSASSLVGFVGAVATYGGPATKVFLNKIGLEKAVKFATKIFGQKLGMAVLDGLPLAVTEALNSDETFRAVLEDPSFNNVFNNITRRLENAFLGELTGARFSIIASTFDKFTTRAVANILATNVTNAIINVVKGNSDIIPPVEDLVFNTLLDIWFSKHGNKIASDEYKALMELSLRMAKPISEMGMIKLIENKVKSEAKGNVKKAASDVAKDYLQKKGVEDIVKKAKAEPVKEPITALDVNDVIELHNRMSKGGKKVTVKELQEYVETKLPKNVVYDNYYVLLTSKLNRNYKELKGNDKIEYTVVKSLKKIIDERLMHGDRDAINLARIYYDFSKFNESPGVTLNATLLFDYYLNNIGVKKADFIKEYGLRVNVKNKDKAKKSDYYAEVSYPITPDGKINMHLKTINTHDYTLVHELFHVMFRASYRYLGTGQLHNIGAKHERVSKIYNTIDSFIRRVKINEVDKVEEGFADLFTHYSEVVFKKDPVLKKLPKTIIDNIEKSIKDYYLNTDYINVVFDNYDHAEIIKLFELLIGRKRMLLLHGEIERTKKTLGLQKQTTDPNIYINKVPGLSSGAKAVNLAKDIKTRQAYINSLKGKLDTHSPGTDSYNKILNRIDKLEKLQNRDLRAINILTDLRVEIDPISGDVAYRKNVNYVSKSTLNNFLKIYEGDMRSAGIDPFVKLLRELSKNKPDYNYTIPEIIKDLNLANVKKDAKLESIVRMIPETSSEVVTVKRMLLSLAKGDKEGFNVSKTVFEAEIGRKINENVKKAKVRENETWVENYMRSVENESKLGVKDLVNDIRIRPEIDDISPLAEWVMTPQFAVRNFPEARDAVNKLINARLATLYTVSVDDVFFRETLKNIQPHEYPTLRKAIEESYIKEMSKEQLVNRYGNNIAEAAIKMRRWFEVIKGEIRDYYRSIIFRYAPKEVADFVNSVSKIKHKSEVYSKIRKAVNDGTLTKYQAKQVRDLWNKLVKIDDWGIWNYVTNIETGTYKVIDSDGHVRAIRLTRKEAIKAAEMLKSQGVKGRLEIVNEYSKIDPMEHRRAKGLSGDPDFYNALRAYSYSIRKRLIVEPAIFEVSSKIAASDKYIFPPNVRKTIEGVIETLRGKYYLEDKIIDHLTKKFGAQGLGATRAVAAIRRVEAAAKLGWRYGAVVVNVLSGISHTYASTSGFSMVKAARWMSTPEGKEFIRKVDKYLGEALVRGEGDIRTGKSLNILHPLYGFSMSETGLRRLSAAANYLYAIKKEKMSPDEAFHFAIDATHTQMFLYDIAALPKLFRSPAGRLAFQFKAYLVQEMQYVSTLPPGKLLKYIVAQLSIGGVQALIHVANSIPFLDSFGLLSKLEDELQSYRVPEDVPLIGGKPWAYGLMGLLGVDISIAAAIQLPNEFREWAGPAFADLIMMYKQLKETMDIGVRDALGLGKVSDTPSGLYALLDNLGRYVVVARYWRDAIDAIFSVEDGQIWVRDRKERKVYPINGWLDIGKLITGMQPIQKGIIQTKYRIWLKQQEKKIKKRNALVSTFIDYYIKGKSIPDWLYEDIMTYGVSPKAIERALMDSDLTLQERQMKIASYLDKIDAWERDNALKEILDAISEAE